MMAETNSSTPSPTIEAYEEGYAPTPLVVSINVVLCIITVTGNLMVIAAFIKDSKIRQTVAFTLILNLSITDLLVGLFIFPVNSYWWLQDGWTLGTIACKLWLVLDYSVLMMSTFIIVYISLDRYWLLTKGLDYQSFQTFRRVIVNLVILWAITLILYFFIAFVIPFIVPLEFEKGNCELEVVKETWFNVFEMVVQFIIPFSGLVFLNYKVYSNIRMRSRGLVSVKYEVSTSDGGTTFHKENGASVEGPPEYKDLEQYAYTNESLAIEIKDKDQVSSNSVSFTSIENEQHSLTHDHEANGEKANSIAVAKTVSYAEDVKDTRKLSKGEDDVKAKDQKSKDKTPIERARRKSSVRKEKVEFRRHRKAAITLAALVSVFFICWLPYYVCAIIGSFCDDCISDRMWEFVSYFQWCNSTINPFIYGLTNVLFRRNFVKFLHITKCCNERHLEVGSSNN